MTQVSSVNAAPAAKGSAAAGFFTKAMLHNGASNIRENLRLMIVILVLHMAAMPLFLGSLITIILRTGHINKADGFLTVAACTTILAAASGMICAMVVFRYLFSKSTVDMKLCLPMTTPQRFVSDFLSGLFIYIVPYIVSAVFTWAGMFAGHMFCDGKTFEYTKDGVPLVWECSVFEKNAPMLWRGMLGGLMLMLMFYIVTVISAACCGSVFDCAAYNILINVMLPVSFYAVVYLVTDISSGLVSGYILRRCLTVFGPFGGAFSLLGVISDMAYDNSRRIDMGTDAITFGEWFISFTAATLVLGIISYLLYRRRKAEDTGTPVVFGLYYHLTLTLVAVTIMFGFEDLIPCLIITAVIYLVMSAVRNRGFGHILKNMIICVITLALVLGCKGIITKTRAFGVCSFVPDPSSVAETTISYRGMFDTDRTGSYPVITDPAMTEVITAAHKELIKEVGSEKWDINELAVRRGSFDIKYKLKSGRIIYRRYPRITSGVLEMLSTLDSTEQMREVRAEHTRQNVLYINRMLDESEKNDRAFRRSDLYVMLSPQWQYKRGAVYYDGSYSIAYNELPADFTERLADCLYSDIISESDADYFTPSGNVYKLIVYNRWGYYVKENYANTLAYLSACGFDRLPVLDGKAAEFFVSDMSLSMTSGEFAEYITGEHIMTSPFTTPNKSEGIYCGESFLYTTEYTKATEYFDDICELLCHSYKEYKTDENCYGICVDGNFAVIPAEYSDVAERAFIRMTADRAAEILTEDYSGDSRLDGYSIYLTKFIEYYGRDRIIPALEYYYSKEAAETIYNGLTEAASINTDIYGVFSGGGVSPQPYYGIEDQEIEAYAIG